MVNSINVKQGGVSINNIPNDAYLIIIYGKDKDEISVNKYDKNVANKSQGFLDKALSTGNIGKVVMAGVTSPIAQNLASKALPSATLGRINSSLYDIMADGKISVGEVAEDFVGSCTNTLDNMATDLGFPTPSALYDAVMPNGMGVISKDFVNLFSKKSQEENIDIEKEIKDKGLVASVIKLKLVRSDEESLGIGVPTRKTENNFNIATSINNHNEERNFEIMIVHDEGKKVNMYQVKNQLKQLRKLREAVDVYINDKDVQESEIIKDCLLSDLSFSTENKNSIVGNISFTEVPKWDVVIDATLDKSLSGGSSASGNKTTPKTPKTNIKNNDTKFSNIKNFEIPDRTKRDNVQAHIDKYKTLRVNGDEEYKIEAENITQKLRAANKKYKDIQAKDVIQIIDKGFTESKLVTP